MNPIGFMYLLLGLMAVAALAMCAGAAAALEYGPPRRHRRRGPPRKNGSDGAGLAGLLRLWTAAVAALKLPGLGMVRRENLRQGYLLRRWPSRWDSAKHPAPGLAPAGAVPLPHPDVLLATPPITAERLTRQVAEQRLALTDAQRWPELQRQWSDDTGGFPALIDATGGA